ncbi:DMT family transporter [Streptomyces sp. JV176]|uniref:DMT family transporter n=1 Tax=Streptomyces sp. JV176 TaxID=858630 RepID=UPI002E77A6D1|nr:DMT family transporter [Streptomyces sp. JV176]MEE1803095.1 DMT family transporter [Streptomyces sp. JV176]
MSAGMAVAVALSLVSAVAYACAAVAQERLAARTRQGTPLLSLLRRGPWWSAVGLNATGALLHVVALTYGPLTVVQPLGALTLVAAVPLGARRAGRQVSRGEWRGTALTLVGLAIILLTAAGASPERTLTLPQALGVAGVAMALVALLTRPGARPGLRHAAASGIISGVASALTQTVTVAATEREGATGALPLWQVGAVALVVAAFASGGLLLSQTAYRGGLGAPLAVLTLANPVAASVIGLALLGEGLQGGELGVAAALVGAVVAARGVVLLTRTAAVTAGTAGPSSTPEPVPAGSAPAVSAPTYRAATLRAERRRRRAGATRSAVSRRAICPVPADPEEAEVTGPVGRVPRQRRLRRRSRAAA